ncbi:transglutaminase family protein [uncultured Cohaesibacter sp.]|uniref:transglutaminase family protein n=1 Tax=uncultured Cohaesibacter sp. TaxID=1002546 RepID=UPI0029C88F71|nr:transglutaminase family protein [uncultured Cohaesibacter sp.]
MRYRITHKTEYRYATPVAQSNHLVHLTPCAVDGQIVEQHAIAITPAPAHRRDFTDYFGNSTIHLTMEEDHSVLTMNAQTTVTVTRDHSPLLAKSVASWEMVRDLMTDAAHIDEAEFACYSTFTNPTPEIAAYGALSFPPGRPLMEAVMDLTRRIFTDFEYNPTVTDIFTPISQVFEMKSGVCQDFAHFQLACLRTLGIPARYVSGYLRTYPPKGKPRLIGADASHAWISVWCPEAGWIDFDPTNNKTIADEHVTLTVGRDFGDVSPISGVILGGGSHFVHVSVDVMPIDDQGQEIGQSISPEQQAEETAAEGATQPELSQAPTLASAQEQSQEQSQIQTQEKVQPADPLPADRTY